MQMAFVYFLRIRCDYSSSGMVMVPAEMIDFSNSVVLLKP